eukprot:scaffold28687_cov30-Prasinocladus_malaysianus.AAC.1
MLITARTVTPDDVAAVSAGDADEIKTRARYCAIFRATSHKNDFSSALPMICPAHELMPSAFWNEELTAWYQ